MLAQDATKIGGLLHGHPPVLIEVNGLVGHDFGPGRGRG